MLHQSLYGILRVSSLGQNATFEAALHNTFTLHTTLLSTCIKPSHLPLKHDLQNYIPHASGSGILILQSCYRWWLWRRVCSTPSYTLNLPDWLESDWCHTHAICATREFRFNWCPVRSWYVLWQSLEEFKLAFGIIPFRRQSPEDTEQTVAAMPQFVPPYLMQYAPFFVLESFWKPVAGFDLHDLGEGVNSWFDMLHGRTRFSYSPTEAFCRSDHQWTSTSLIICATLMLLLFPLLWNIRRRIARRRSTAASFGWPGDFSFRMTLRVPATDSGRTAPIRIFPMSVLPKTERNRYLYGIIALDIAHPITLFTADGKWMRRPVRSKILPNLSGKC